MPTRPRETRRRGPQATGDSFKSVLHRLCCGSAPRRRGKTMG